MCVAAVAAGACAVKATAVAAVGCVQEYSSSVAHGWCHVCVSSDTQDKTVFLISDTVTCVMGQQLQAVAAVLCDVSWCNPGGVDSDEMLAVNDYCEEEFYVTREVLCGVKYSPGVPFVSAQSVYGDI